MRIIQKKYLELFNQDDTDIKLADEVTPCVQDIQALEERVKVLTESLNGAIDKLEQVKSE